jgi:hypothetical protein
MGRKTWRMTLVVPVLAGFGLVGVWASEPSELQPAPDETNTSAVVAEPILEDAQAELDYTPAFDALPGQPNLEPMVCLLLPECFRNSDCDAKCGVGQGRCAHGGCPARHCVCR